MYKTCARCEYFDGGGETKAVAGSNIVLHGDCLNNISPRFETKSNQTCLHFYNDKDKADEYWRTIS